MLSACPDEIEIRHLLCKAQCPPSRSALQCRQAAGRDAPWAVVGVLSEKLPIRAASSGKPYSLWVLSDLNGALMPLLQHAGTNALSARKPP
jgi:hypothetical protein